MAARFMLRKSSLCDAKACFLLTPLGRRFFFKLHDPWTYSNISRPYNFTRNDPFYDPLTFVSREFRRYLVKKCILTMMNPRKGVSPRGANDHCKSIALRDAIETLASNSIECRDDVSYWWSQVLKAGYLWMTGNDEEGHAVSLRLAPTLANDPLSLSLLLAGKLKKYIETKRPKLSELVISLLERGSHELSRSMETRESMTVSPSDCTLQMLHCLQLLCCEWLLSSRVALWEANPSSHPSKDAIAGYRKDLTTLRSLTQVIPNAKAKLYLYEGSLRLMCNLNPLRAQELLERTVRRRNHNAGNNVICTGDDKIPCSLCERKDIASALIQMSRHLPNQIVSCQAEREGYIREATAVLGTQPATTTNEK